MKRGRFEVAVAVGGQDTGSGYDARDLELIAQACTRAAAAIRAKEFGTIVATNKLGTDVADIIVGHSNLPDRWYIKMPAIAKFSDRKKKRRRP